MELELFSITVLGGSRCGKTTLINAFVNNSCPTVLEETESAQLYYKTLNVTSKGGDAAAPPQPAMVEIEDTYAASKSDGLDEYDQPRKIDTFLRMDRAVHTDGEAVELLQGYEIPEVSEYRPLSPRRMAFMLVFDCTSQLSLKEAQDLHSAMRMDIDASTRPVVCLVANCLDADATDGEQRRLAQRYAKDSNISYFELSAYDLKKVKQLFRSVLSEIYAKEDLWRPTQHRRKAFSRVEDIDKNEFDNENNREAQKKAEEEEFTRLSREAAEAAQENKVRMAHAAEAAEERRRQAVEEEKRQALEAHSEEDQVPYEPQIRATAVATPAPTSTGSSGPRLHWSQASLASTSQTPPPLPPPSSPPGANTQTTSEDRFGLSRWLPASFFA
ncbi:unnamed protein product [Symbiodinium natans]|uniref:Uncharacterized protein n=1 Tax=Symbiodinium natans TaxID=878477 RepID=A0A812U1A7_9DINO|nr:unnamed protein product [Symbiodinium natans]